LGEPDLIRGEGAIGRCSDPQSNDKNPETSHACLRGSVRYRHDSALGGKR
jgi:hypothetical protein